MTVSPWAAATLFCYFNFKHDEKKVQFTELDHPSPYIATGFCNWQNEIIGNHCNAANLFIFHTK